MKQALIVEDRPEVAIMYKRSLQELDYEVHIAFDLQSAFVVLGKTPPPDVVLLDLNLNEKENAQYTVHQVSRIRAYNPDMVLVVISGVLTPELVATAISQGADQVKEKLDMLKQVDLWKAIEDSYTKAPQSIKEKMSHQLELLQRFARRLDLL